MTDIKKLIAGLEYSWEYIKERPNPTATPKAMAMSNIRKAIDFLKGKEAGEPGPIAPRLVYDDEDNGPMNEDAVRMYYEREGNHERNEKPGV